MFYNFLQKALVVFCILYSSFSLSYEKIPEVGSKPYLINDGYMLTIDDGNLAILNSKGSIAIKFDNFIPKVKGDYGDYYFLFDLLVPSDTEKKSQKISMYWDDSPINLFSKNIPYSFVLKSVKEDYATQQFYIYVLFKPEEKSLNIVKVIGATRSPECMNELVSAREVKLKKFHSIDSKNITDIYSNLYSVDGDTQRIKIPFLDDIRLYRETLKGFENKEDISSNVSMFIMENEDGEKCEPSSYVVERWFWNESIEGSNNIAYFLSESGYHQEAIALLEEIILLSPDRISAYINLADSLWAVKKYDKARFYYGEYIAKMKRKHMFNKVPNHVLERTKMNG